MWHATRTAVLGAGALGLTLAYRLAQGGDAVSVFERGMPPVVSRPGLQSLALTMGSRSTLRSSITTSSRLIVRPFGCLKNWVSSLDWCGQSPFRRYFGTAGLHCGCARPLRLAALPFPDRLRLGMAGAYLKFEKGYQRLEGQTASEWSRRWMGANAYSVFVEPLLRQKFGMYADESAMPWLLVTFHLRSAALGYLKAVSSN